MLFRKRRQAMFGIALAGMLATGCGAPELSLMKPNVWKPVAAVFLVNQPTNWTATNVVQVGEQAGVFTKVFSVSQSDVAEKLLETVNKGQVGLCVVVSDQPISQDVLDVAQAHIANRFEFISSSAETTDSLNVRSVVADSNTASYTLGWLAGQLAGGTQTSSLGWVVDGSTQSTKDNLRAALAGAYAAAGTTNIQPVTLSTAVAGQIFPKVIVVGRTLTASEMALLSTSGSLVISLVNQPVGIHVVADPSIPSSLTLDKDFQSFSNQQWHAGAFIEHVDAGVNIDKAVVGENVQTMVNAQEQTLTQNGLNVNVEWSHLPSALQQTFASIVALGT